MSEFGRRWNNHNGGGANSTTDMDSDYRREMAGLTGTGVHHEARGRDGGGGASTLQRRHRVRGGARPGDSSADASPVAGARCVRIERWKCPSQRKPIKSINLMDH